MIQLPMAMRFHHHFSLSSLRNCNKRLTLTQLTAAAKLKKFVKLIKQWEGKGEITRKHIFYNDIIRIALI